MCEVSQKELQELAEKHQEQLTEVASLKEKLTVSKLCYLSAVLVRILFLAWKNVVVVTVLLV